MNELLEGKKDKISLITNEGWRKFFFLRFPKYSSKDFSRKEAMDVWSKRFLDSKYPMVVIHPSFRDFSKEYLQSYVFLPLSELRDSSVNIPSAEKKFYINLLENKLKVDDTVVAYLPDGCYSEKGFSVKIDLLDELVQFLSKKEVLKRIIPELEVGLPSDDGGIYCPTAEAGVFYLDSL